VKWYHWDERAAQMKPWPFIVPSTIPPYASGIPPLMSVPVPDLPDSNRPFNCFMKRHNQHNNNNKIKIKQPQQQQQQQQQLGGETAFFKISNNHTTASSTVAPCSLPFSPIPITPYPYSPCQQELEDRKQYPLPEVVDYSCYFQPLPDQDQKPELFSSPNRSCEEMNNESHAHAHRTLLQQDQQHMRLTSSPAQISDTDSMEELDTDF